MNIRFVTSPDGKRIAYDLCGSGPAVVLLHGGGGSRQEWHEAGYVQRLQEQFTVIALDLRGHGQSALPTDPADYTIDKMEADILAVVDACGVERFALWGMSYGGKVGRYLAAHSRRVTKMVLIGTPMGPGVSGVQRQEALDFCVHWLPILQAQSQGNLDPVSLSPHEQEMFKHLNISAMLGWVQAMLDWPSVKPGDFLCQTLWLIGSQDAYAIDSLQEYQATLADSRVQVQILDGLDHMQVFEGINQVLPAMLEFTRA